MGALGRGTRAALLAVMALAACEVQAPAPVTPPATPQEPEGAGYASPLSRELADYYARVERDLLAQGLMRTDGGGPDTPFTQHQLVEDFIRIALYEEFSNVGGFMVARQTRSRLHRWEKPVRIGIEFGASVPEEQRRADRAEIAAYARRLARIADHPISVVSQGANFHVLVVSEDERRRLGPHLKELAPSLSPAAIRAIEDLPRSTFCLVFAVDPDGSGTYDRAVAIIRAEHPPLMRRSCIHEEIAQGLGLANDSPDARPSIFNDDEEFALLTTHDELLLKMLYDPRMRPGMTPEEARPVAEIIAAELMGGPA